MFVFFPIGSVLLTVDFRASVRIAEDRLSSVLLDLRKIPQATVLSMKEQVHHIFKNYLSTMEAVALTTIKVSRQNSKLLNFPNEPQTVLQ